MGNMTEFVVAAAAAAIAVLFIYVRPGQYENIPFLKTLRQELERK